MNVGLLDKMRYLITLAEGKIFRKDSEWSHFIGDNLFDVDLLLVQFLRNHELAHQILILLLLFLVLLLKSLDLLKLNNYLGCSEKFKKLVAISWERAATIRGI